MCRSRLILPVSSCAVAAYGPAGASSRAGPPGRGRTAMGAGSFDRWPAAGWARVRPTRRARQPAPVAEIEEYARHNAHADLILERVDGVTGDGCP